MRIGEGRKETTEGKGGGEGKRRKAKQAVFPAARDVIQLQTTELRNNSAPNDLPATD